MAVILENDWGARLYDEFRKEYYLNLRERLAVEYRSYTVYPDMYDIFNALALTGYSDTKAVILGQDPYHEEGQAQGLSFSVPRNIAIPPSLVNIYKELNSDIGAEIPNHGNLVSWTGEGVLLLNSVLTVRAHAAASHKNLGWENFTDTIISMLSQRDVPLVFILWGNFAQSKRPLIDESRHLVLCAPHPSPLSASRGFFGSRPFSQTNEFLSAHGIPPINWELPK